MARVGAWVGVPCMNYSVLARSQLCAHKGERNGLARARKKGGKIWRVKLMDHLYGEVSR